MAYERLDEALRLLKTDRECEEATEKQQKREGEEARMRFAQIKSAVIGPIFNEIVAHVVAEGFFGEMVGRSKQPEPSQTNQIVFDDECHKLDEMTMELVREKAEQFVLDLIAGKLFH
jgi:hypothetical protein